MTIQASDIETVANMLLSGNNEASHRSSASRFYYSGWHLMQQTVKDSKTLAVPAFADTKGGMHKSFFDGLDTLGGNAKRCAIILSAMHHLRIAADYKVSKSFAKEQAYEVKNHLENLKKIASTLDTPPHLRGGVSKAK